ncbi:MAG: DNA methyltransferase [Methanocella sp.]
MVAQPDILSLDLDFHDETSTYSSHALHAFAAKFPPQLPGIFIDRLTKPGDTVLDPMNGSGTTTLEAYLRGRRAIGCDIDPLAVRIARVKATPVQIDAPGLTDMFIKNARSVLEDDAAIRDALDLRFDEKTRRFIDYWFFPETAKELMALLLSIEEYPHGSPVRELLEVVFSGIIVTKSGGVSRARDLAHSRPHIDETRKPKSAIKAFELRLRKFAPVIAALPDHAPYADIVQCSARKLAVKDDSAHLIVTSPPYANAIDYMRANKFSLAWLGMPVADLGRLRSKYIGSETTGDSATGLLPPYTEDLLHSLGVLDRRKEAVLRKYYLEMRDALTEMCRVLLPGHYAIVVVGTSTMRGLDVRTPYCLADIAEHDAGFDMAGILHRSLDRDRRMMPFSKGVTQIEQRMGTEEVIVLKKPA